MHYKRLQLTLLLSMVLAALPLSQAQGQMVFSDIALSAGVGSESYDSSSRHGLGIIWIDYDNDGFPDLFASNGAGLPSHLYHNEGNGTFTNADDLIPTITIEATSAMFADYDNDGDKDIYLMAAGGDLLASDGELNLLLQNQWVENGNQIISGQPLFIDVAAAAGVDNPSSGGATAGYDSYTGAWLDYDRDGCIDLFVGTMVWDQAGLDTNANFLYKNNCDGTFTDVTLSSGVDTGDSNDLRPTLAFFGGLLTPGDIDPDLYVVNVHDASPFHHDLIYSNDGDGTFTEFSATMPTFGDDTGAGMGTAVGDIDMDGDWDIYISDLPNPPVEPVQEGNALYLGNPDGTWSENAGKDRGVASFSSWGANFADFDMDGDEDLYVGVIAPDPLNEMLFENDGTGDFTDVSSTSGMETLHEARGTAVADFDRDGDLDIAQVNLNGRINLYENITSTTNNYIAFELDATVSNASAIGTLVELTDGGVTQMRQINGGASAHSQDDLIVHFGVGSDTNIDEVKISWPSGIVTTLTNVGVNQLMTVTEEAVAPSSLFTEVSAAAGVAVLHDAGSLSDMGMGSGAAWFDYDGDGDQDLYMTMRTGPNFLFQNNGGTFTDVAAAAGVQDATGDGSGVAVADYDNDGDKDLYLANGDEDVFFENNGDGTFTDITAGSGLESSGDRRGTSASWGDFDRDGLLDLYVAHHEPIVGSGVPLDNTQAQDYLYVNNGDGTFTDVSTHLGVSREGHSFIGSFTDYDNDGDLDIFKINDCPFDDSAQFRLFRNDGGTDAVTDWTFTEDSANMNADWCQNGMGIAVGDYDRDGDFDYYVSDNGADGTVPVGQKGIAGTTLLRNDGTQFTEVSVTAGVDSREWSWGANFFDYDLDGFQDLYLAAGAMNTFDPTPSQIWQNDGDGTFTNVNASSGGLDDDERTRTSVYADYDGDGDPDMFLVNYAGNTKLFQNNNNNGNNWLIVDLQGTTSNRDGIGSKLELTTTDGVTQHFETRSGSSLGGGDDIGAYFGFGSASITSLTVTWPSGTVQTVTPGINQRVLVVEDGGTGGSTLAASPTSVDFGQVEEGSSSSPVAVTLTNEGVDAIDVTGVSISGADASEFSHDFGSTVTIPGGGTSTVNVTFSPVASSAPQLAGTVLYRVNAAGSVIEDWTEDSVANPSAYVNETATTTQSTADVVTFDTTVPAGTPMEIFQSSRKDAAKADPNMEWDFPVTSGDTLNVRLFFAEIVRCQTGGHVFDVVIEDVTVLEEYDPHAELGCNVGTMKEFEVIIGDDNLDIDFPLGDSNRPSLISAIEVSTSGGGGGSAVTKNADMTIDHTGLNASLTVSLTGEATSDGGGTPTNEAPTAAFSFSPTDLSVAFTDASTDSDGSVVSWSWDFGDGNSSSDQNPTHAYGAYGTYTVELTVTDDDGATGTASESVTLSDPNADGAFIEDAGMIVMEAENYHQSIDRGDHSWSSNTDNAGFSGASSMLVGPDSETIITADVPTTSAELLFDVDVTTTGDYYIWVRMWATDSDANSVFVGANGALNASTKGLQTQTLGEWIWLRDARGGQALTHNLGTAGAHTISVWMREDGTIVDKVVVTNDVDFVPTGEGPAESGQVTAPVTSAKANADEFSKAGIAGDEIQLPTEYALNGNYPNPFNPTTTISYDLPEASSVRLEVYDMMGRRVATLVNADQGAGSYETVWNARNDAGSPVASGVYIYRIQAGSFQAVQQMVLMK